MDGEVPGLGKMVQPVCDVIHRCSLGAALTKLPIFVIGIHAIEHDKLYNIRINFFPVKKIADSVKKRDRSAIVFACLVI